MDKAAYYESLAGLNIINRITCTKEEQKTFYRMKPEELPEDVYLHNGLEPLFVRYTGLEKDALDGMLQVIMAKDTRIIKNCVIFFVTLASLAILFNIITYFL